MAVKEDTLLKEEENTLQMATIAHQKYLLRTSGEDLLNAINLYIETIKKHPEISQTYYRLATLLYDNKQISLEGAIEQCQQAVVIDPKNSDAHMYLGYYLALAGNRDDAREHFKISIKLKPFASARTRIIMALVLLEKKIGPKNLAEAFYSLFSGALLFLVDKASIKMLLKNLADDFSFIKYTTLGKVFEKFSKDKKAYALYHQALNDTKNQPLFYEKMARIAIKKHKDDIALHCFQNAVKISGNSTDAIVNMIEFLEEKFPNKIDDLIDSYNLLTNQNPEFSRCYYELGHLYLKKNEKLNALNAFKFALRYDSENPFYINSLAFACVQLEQFDEALLLYQKAYDLNPDSEWSAIVAQAMAMIYHQVKGESEAAISILNNALLLTNNKAQVYQMIADIHYDINNLDEALRYYEIALENDCDNPQAYSRLAMAYWEKDYVEKAIINYSKAIDLDPNYDIAYNNLGVIFLDGLGDANRALTYFETALDINDKYVLAYFNCARAHEVLNEKISAAHKYQKALDLNKTRPEMEDVLIQERLYKLFDA